MTATTGQDQAVKTCSHCRSSKPLVAFHKNRLSSDGVAYWCKECVRELNRERKRNQTQAEPEPTKVSDTKRRLPKSIVYPLGDLPDQWRRLGACVGQNPKVWTASRSNASAPRALRRVCAGCPVAVPCLTEGLHECRVSSRTSDTTGTRGGTSPWVRHKLYRAWLVGDLGEFRELLLAADWEPARADEMIGQLSPVPSKECTSCGGVKPLSGFYVNGQSTDGVASWCKECTRESNRAARGGRQ